MTKNGSSRNFLVRLKRLFGRLSQLGDLETSVSQIRREQLIAALQSQDLVGFEQRLENLRALIAPPDEAKFVPKYLVGDQGDGSYVLADLPIRDPSSHAFLSIGVGDEVSADYFLAEKGHPIFLFDHTITRLPKRHKRFLFSKKGLGAHDRGDYLSLKTILGSLPNSIKTISLMCDIEGAEWEAFSTAGNLLTSFDQMSFEFHGLLNYCLADDGDVLEVLNSMRQNFTPIYWTPNNVSPRFLLQGYFVPDIVEITFLRDDIYEQFLEAKNSTVAVKQPLNKGGLWSVEVAPFSKVTASDAGSV